MPSCPLQFRTNCSSGTILLAIGVIAFVGGLVLGNAAAVALGLAFVTVPLVIYVLLRRSMRSLVLSQVAPDAAFEGDAIDVAITLTNESRFPLFFPRFSEIFGPELHAQKNLLFPDRVQVGESVTRSYRGLCLCPRGSYTFGDAAIRASDPFGWFEVRRYLSNDSSIKVYPRLAALRARERAGDAASHAAQAITRLARGDSNDFYGVREYVPGDPLRRIAWRLYAHRGVPVVRETQRTSTGDLVIALDLNRRSQVGTGRDSSLEVGVRIAASVSAHALKRGHGVRLVIGGEPKRAIRLERGARQVVRVLDALVDAHAVESHRLAATLDREGIDIHPGTTLVVMVNAYLHGDEELAGLLRGFVRRRIRVVAVLFPVDASGRREDVRAVEARLNDFAGGLRSDGVVPIAISPGVPLEAVLEGQS